MILASMWEEGPLLQNALEAAGPFALVSIQVITSHLIDGDENGQAGFGPRDRCPRPDQREAERKKHSPK
jgi:hypothetical protein